MAAAASGCARRSLVEPRCRVLLRASVPSRRGSPWPCAIPYDRRPRRECGELHAADAAVADRAHGVRLSAPARGGARRRGATRGRRPTRARAGSRPRSPRAASAAATRSRVMASNTPEMVEAHFGVPMTGAVLNTLNTRLDADAIAFMLQHGEAKVLITDTEFAPIDRAGAGAARRASRWSSTSTTRSAPAASALGDDRLRSVHRRRRSGLRVAAIPPTSGTRSRSTTPRAPPAIRRASSTTIAAPT